MNKLEKMLLVGGMSILGLAAKVQADDSYKQFVTDKDGKQHEEYVRMIEKDGGGTEIKYITDENGKTRRQVTYLDEEARRRKFAGLNVPEPTQTPTPKFNTYYDAAQFYLDKKDFYKSLECMRKELDKYQNKPIPKPVQNLAIKVYKGKIENDVKKREMWSYEDIELLLELYNKQIGDKEMYSMLAMHGGLSIEMTSKIKEDCISKAKK